MPPLSKIIRPEAVAQVRAGWISKAEIAAALGVTPKHVQWLVRHGRLPQPVARNFFDLGAVRGRLMGLEPHRGRRRQ